jgi:hypothetical protein
MAHAGCVVRTAFPTVHRATETDGREGCAHTSPILWERSVKVLWQPNGRSVCVATFTCSRLRSRRPTYDASSKPSARFGLARFDCSETAFPAGTSVFRLGWISHDHLCLQFRSDRLDVEGLGTGRQLDRLAVPFVRDRQRILSGTDCALFSVSR